MKGFIGCLLLVLGTLVAAASCNGGANDVAGVNGGAAPATPTPIATPHARPTPDPCRQNPADCDVRSQPQR